VDGGYAARRKLAPKDGAPTAADRVGRRLAGRAAAERAEG
jgi:hypothetical protein